MLFGSYGGAPRLRWWRADVNNEQLVRRLFELFGRRDLDQAVALFAEAAEFQVPGSSAISGTYRGRAGVLEFWRRQIDVSAGSLRTQVVSLETAGDEVVVDVDVTAAPDGEPLSWRRTVTYRISDGLIVLASLVEGDQGLADRVFGLCGFSGGPTCHGVDP
jgi:ketosteroid isomerase-like protein